MPEEPNGTLRGYYVYCGEKMVEHTTELSVIISGLVPGTSYDIQVGFAIYMYAHLFNIECCRTNFLEKFINFGPANVLIVM